MTKTCTKCGVAKAATSVEFQAEPRNSDGLISHCRACRRKANRGWRVANRESQIARSTAWNQANPDRVRARDAARYEVNRLDQIQRVKEWQKANPEKVRAKNYRRRALATAIESHKPYRREDIFARDMWVCQLCFAPVQTTNTDPYSPTYPTIDHVTPLSLGGADAPDNVQLAHRRCNVRKGNRRPPAMAYQ